MLILYKNRPIGLFLQIFLKYSAFTIADLKQLICYTLVKVHISVPPTRCFYIYQYYLPLCAMEKFAKLFLHTGSNLGNRAENLKIATNYISEEIGSLVKASAVYETKPWGIENQPDFLNQALEIATHYDPFEVLDRILNIEKKMGRKREIKWGERLIDIDILFYGDEIIQAPRLNIPHPYLHHRNFVLIPLLEIAPQFRHPVLQASIQELYSTSQDPLEVEAI